MSRAARLAVGAFVLAAALDDAGHLHAEEGSSTRSEPSQSRPLFGDFNKKLAEQKKAEQREAAQRARDAKQGGSGAREMSATSSEGSGSREAMGSGTREPMSAVRASKPSKAYERPLATKVDPKLESQVAVAAAEIDRLIMEKLKAEKIRPNPKTNDMQFVRRAYLDITGTIPTARQTVEFLSKSRKSNKRAELIDELLNSTGHVSHSFNYWADILRLKDIPSEDNLGRPYVDWIKDVLASDMAYDDFVYAMLTAEGRVWDHPATGYVLRDLGMPLSNLDNTVRIFLGTRVGCAQCHDHPFDRWTQKEFYQLAAFIHPTVMQANRKQIDAAVAPAMKEIRNIADLEQRDRLRRRARDISRINQRSVGEAEHKMLKLPHDYQYDDGEPGELVEPAVIFGEQPELTANTSRRQAFARWLAGPENPRFTLTIANRLWKRAFGVGVIDPVDDLTDESEPTNEALMDFLIAEMKRVNYSQREFLRILYNTEAYQREAYRKNLVATEPYHFPGPVLRRMTAEQVWDSMLTLTLADPEQYQRPTSEKLIEAVAISPGDELDLDAMRVKIKDREDEYRNGREAKLKKKYTHKGELLVRASEMSLPLGPSHFLRQFGQSDRELISGGTTEGHVPQILTMFNGKISHKLLYEGTVIYDEVMAAPELRDKIDVIFLSILSRKPTRSDRKLALAEIQSNGPAGFGNVIWALLNTREFLFIQ
ncbi:MAG: DUF1549 domain-containing protein [Planctomycetota bacterium]